ncbi:unnamed protein product [Meganyctiphanes norvegica]|uniref:Uncharacterized protein n=1 Tax=Meganyctiphanes norvegica TaxID=48144 RepID=A0AAV2RMB9_MEGNR
MTGVGISSLFTCWHVAIPHKNSLKILLSIWMTLLFTFSFAAPPHQDYTSSLSSVLLQESHHGYCPDAAVYNCKLTPLEDPCETGTSSCLCAVTAGAGEMHCAPPGDITVKFCCSEKKKFFTPNLIGWKTEKRQHS